MSFRLQPQPPARPNRCQLFGPGSNVRLFEKMAASAADVINIDLEDSVAPTDKDAARANTVQAINEIDWQNKTLSVRINGLDTGWWYRDVVDLLEKGGDRLDQIMIPKAGCAADIYAVDALVTSIETAQGRRGSFTFINFAVRKDLLGDRASVTVRLRDPFGLAGFNFTIDRPTLYQEFERTWGAQQVGLTFQYNFGQQQRQQRRDRDGERGGGGDLENEF